ncbi:cGMP-specific 3',5'-cyclic phosphodiesterase-like [Argonauta hians]
MSTTQVLNSVENFLELHPDFLEKWLSARGLEEIPKNNTKLESIVTNPTNFLTHFPITPDLLPFGIRKFRKILHIVNSQIDLKTAIPELLKNIRILLNCQTTYLCLVEKTCKNKYHISNVYSSSNDLSRHEFISDLKILPIPISFEYGTFGYIIQNQCLLNVKNVRKNQEIINNVEGWRSKDTESIMLTPVLCKKGLTLAVVIAKNKLKGNSFDYQDETNLDHFSRICSSIIIKARSFEMAQMERKRSKMILKLINIVIERHTEQQTTFSEILKCAVETLHCDISLHLLEETDSPILNRSVEVLHLGKNDKEPTMKLIDPKLLPILVQSKMASNTLSIVSLAEIVQGTNVTLEGVFGNWVVCLPICDASKRNMGTVSFLRESTNSFNESEMNIMGTIATFAGLVLHNNYLYKSCNKIQRKSVYINEWVDFHTTCDEREVHKIQFLDMGSPEHYNIYSFSFNSTIHSLDDTILIVARIFLEMNALELLEIPINLLYRWILTIRKNYRLKPYHNWDHAVTACQTMFAILTIGKLKKHFTEFEVIFMLSSILSHDVDHRGTNNAFEGNIVSALAIFYDSPVLENHHIQRTLMILKNDKTNIFYNFSTEKYKEALQFHITAILATDLVSYFEDRKSFERFVDVGTKNFKQGQPHLLLIKMMMTASDLSGTTKPWEQHKVITMLLANEFYKQGDMERQRGIPVLPLMNREKRGELPKMQIGFIDFACVMVYRLLGTVEEYMKPLWDRVLKNRENWTKIVKGEDIFDYDYEYANAMRLSRTEVDIKDEHKSYSSLIKNKGIQTEISNRNRKQEQQTSQTILSYPVQKLISINDLIIPVWKTFGLDTVTKECQTSHTTPYICHLDEDSDQKKRMQKDYSQKLVSRGTETEIKMRKPSDSKTVSRRNSQSNSNLDMIKKHREFETRNSRTENQKLPPLTSSTSIHSPSNTSGSGTDRLSSGGTNYAPGGKERTGHRNKQSQEQTQQDRVRKKIEPRASQKKMKGFGKKDRCITS